MRAIDTSGVKVLFAALLVLLALSSGTAPAQSAAASGAVGVVIRHSNGRLLYALIPLKGGAMTGAEALQKSGLTLNVSAGGALGVAVCTIDGEGCESPKEDCFCKSYGDPALYWHYYQRNADGSWRTSALGAGNRILHDGDVDGWSWTGSGSNLPPVTLEQIAAAVQSTDATPTPSPASAVSDVPAPAPTAIGSTLATPTETQPQSAAAIIAPNGSATPLAPTTKPSDPSRGRAVGGFAAVAAVMLALLALVPLGARRRRRRTED